LFKSKLLNIEVCSDIIQFCTVYTYQISLQITASNFTVQAVQHFKL